MSEASRESFPFWSLAEKPSRPVSTMKPRIEPTSSRSPVLAQITATSAMDPFVIHILAPLRTHSSPSSTARVIMPPGLEPKSGSVRPKHPMDSPLAIRGSHSRFCASDPKAKIGYMTRAPCTDTKERRPESARSSSCMMRP